MIDVAMVTYNQEEFIANAIESVLKQKTTFPFRLVIGEDCSTDNTREICLNYAKNHPEKIKLISQKSNQGLLKNYQSVFKECNAKYLAILEGDDYWIDDYKLQKQIDLLESDSQIGFVHANFNILTQSEVKRYIPPSHVKLAGHIYDDLIVGNFIGPLTVCARKELIDKYVDFDVMLNLNFKTIDYVIWLELSKNSVVGYQNESVAVYRKEKGSVSLPSDFDKYEQFMISILRTLNYFENKYSSTNKNIFNTSYNLIYYDLLLKAIHYKCYTKVQYYRLLFKPKSFLQYLKWLMCQNLLLLKLFKKIKFFN